MCQLLAAQFFFYDFSFISKIIWRDRPEKLCITGNKNGGMRSL